MKAIKIYAIARREYVARVRSKAFLITTLMVPALMGFYAVIIPAMSRADVDEIRVMVVDAGTGLGDTLSSRLSDIDRLPFVMQSTETIRESDLETRRTALSDAVRNNELDGYIVLRPDPDTLARGQYYARETGNILIIETIESAVERTILENWFDGEELDRLRRVQRTSLETITVSASGEETGGFLMAYASTMILGMLLYMTVLMYGQQMAMAIVEEKSSRLVEMIIGAVTATEYMLGKIVGVFLTGLTQLLIWLLMVAIMILGVLPALAIGASMANFNLAEVLDVRVLAYFSVFFLLGYLMYATIFAAVGATCDSLQEMQQAMMPAIMPVIMAFMSTFYIMGNPNSFASRVLSFIPIFTPLTMFTRVNVSEPPFWEVWLGIFLLLATTAFTVWGAAKIFRATILFHGKRPSWREIIRMARAAS